MLYFIRNKSKTMTKEGKARRGRICEKLFTHDKYTQLVMNYYASVLPMLKEYILMFQTQEPLIHKLHDHQMATTK